MQNVIVGWLVRRGLELGGLIGTLAMVYQSLPPATQAAIGRAVQGDWQDITLGALFPLIVAIWGYVWSFRATVQPQVVTADAQKIPLPRKGEEGVSTTRKVETLATAAPAPKTLWERITGK